MRVLLFALTGLGNFVVEKLYNMGIDVVAVVSRQERGKYPHFTSVPLSESCCRLGIKKIDVPEKGRWWDTGIEACWDQATLVLSSTFHRIIPVTKLAKVKYGAYNIHPSLLPKHKGPVPVFWAVHNGDEKYGYTVHELTDRADEGIFYYQRDLPLGNITAGAALYNVYKAVEEDLEKIIENIKNKKTIIEQYPGSYEQRPLAADYNFEVTQSPEKLLRELLACLPYPGVLVYLCGQPWNLLHASIITPDAVQQISNDSVLVPVQNKLLRLELENYHSGPYKKDEIKFSVKPNW